MGCPSPMGERDMPICPVCKAQRPVHNGPGVPVLPPSMIHESTCSTLPQPTAQDRREYQEWLDEYRRCQRAAWEAASHWIIG